MTTSIREFRSLVDKIAKKDRQPDRVAAFMLEKLAISRPAIPVQLIAESLGVRVIETELEPDVSGALILRESDAIIAINSSHSKNRRRFTLAHEIGHLVLKHSGMESHVDRQFTVLRRDSNSSTATDDREIEANRFAAELLMPMDFIVKEFVKFGHFDEETIGKLAIRYAVSPIAFKIRLSNLGFYSPVE
jgi:Zn-dependent peptidase ImmA (M78 family)